MTRKEFLEQVGIGGAVALLATCGVGCEKANTPAPAPQTPAVDFTVSVASGALSSNGGFIIQSGIIIARTMSATYIAVAAACTHAGSTIGYNSATNDFTCPNHGAKFDANGAVTNGPATTALTKYNTSLSGTTLRVFS